MVRIRDPVTSKVRTIFLNDTQIDELSKRHEQDKSKVSNALSSAKPQAVTQQSHPSSSHSTSSTVSNYTSNNSNPNMNRAAATTIITSNPIVNRAAAAATTSNPIVSKTAININDSSNSSGRATASGIVEKPRRPLNIFSVPSTSTYPMEAFVEANEAENRANKASSVHQKLSGDNEDNFEKLLERHNNEKRVVNDFKKQYVNEQADKADKSMTSVLNHENHEISVN